MKLSDVCSVHSGYSARERLEPQPEGVLALPQASVSPEGTFEASAAIRVALRYAVSQHVVATGDVLFRSRGLAAAAWAVDDVLAEPAIALLPLYILRPATDVLDAGFLAWLLMRGDAQAHFAKEAVGSNLQMIRKPAISSLPITLPPLAMQRSVASAVRLGTLECNLTTRLSTLRRDLLTLQLEERTRSTDHDRNKR
jgi:hypothetical protein